MTSRTIPVAMPTLGERLSRINNITQGAAIAVISAIVIASSFALGLFALIDSSRLQARVLADNVGAALAFHDAKAANDQLLALHHFPQVSSVTILDEDQSVFARYEANGQSTPVSGAPSMLAAQSLNLRSLAMTEPILIDGRSRGSVHLAVDLFALYMQTLWQLLAMVLAAWLAWQVSRRLLQRLRGSILTPLAQLGELTQRVSQDGDYCVRAAPGTISELDHLARGFNTMLDQIEQRDKSLQDHCDDLIISRNDLASTLRAIPDLLFEIDLDGRYHSAHSPRSTLLVAPQNMLLGKLLTDVMPVEASTTCMAALNEANGKGYSNGRQIELTLENELKWFELSVSRKDGIDPDNPHFIVLSRDITERKLAQSSQQLAASVFSHAREGIVITDVVGTIVDVNEAFTRITGFPRDEAMGQNTRILKSTRQSREFYKAMWHELEVRGHWSGEIWNCRKNGEVYPEMLTISAVRNIKGETQHYVALFTDITVTKEHQSQLEHIAQYDALTGLSNRVLLADRLQQAMLQCQRRDQSIAVVYLDLDGFKAVNDKHGHDVGDGLLIAIAQRMKAALREGDTLARIGGDEFVAVLADLNQTSDSDLVLLRLLEAASDPTMVKEQTLQVSASIGVTFYPADCVDADQLMRHADQAMYQAKQAGKNRFHVFDLLHDAAMQDQQHGLQDIRYALERGEFVLHYQPKVNMRTGAVIGAEALIRWQNPERGLLPPAAFLPIVEGHDISLELGEWVIATALAQMSAWQADGIHIPVSVNISARQLQQSDFVVRLSGLLARYPDVLPNCLELEVLETSALDDAVQVSKTMHACRAIGVQFSLDDFGTGYSSLTYLKHLPAETLKIDRSFVRDMLSDPDDLAIVQGVVGLATAFNRNVIAEGVETAAHGAMLLSLGCELAQGFGIARPMPALDLPSWVMSWQAKPVWTA